MRRSLRRRGKEVVDRWSAASRPLLASKWRTWLIKAVENIRRQQGPRRLKYWLLGLVLIRTCAALAAFPLAPFLIEKHSLVLVFLRPTNLVVFLSGALVKTNEVEPWQIVAAAFPLQVVIIWLYYLVGKAWSDELGADDKLPFLMTRLLPAEQIKRLRHLIQRKGDKFVFFSRFAMFPTGLVAATAGAGDLGTKRFFLADALGTAASSGAALGVGYALGQAAFNDKWWILVAGTVGFILLSGALRFYLEKSSKALEP